MSAMQQRFHFGPPLVGLVMLLAGLALAWPLVARGLAGTGAGYDAQRMVALHATLPRLATALLAGAALSLAGALFQHVLRNPLASPTTLGIAAGANLALVIATLFFPALLGLGRDMVALVGSALVAAIVMGLGARRGFSPFSLVMSGLVISLWCGALAAVLIFFNEKMLVSLFIWGAGSLAQQSWDIPVALLWQFILLAGLSTLIVRPLDLLDLGDGGAAALGVKLGLIRFLAIAIAVLLTAFVTSAVGVIGFIGLVAPLIARLAGARRVGQSLVWSSLIGAALLLITDAAIQFAAGAFADFLPTGAVTALFGTPLLLLLLPRLKTRHRLIAAPMRPERRRINGRQARYVILPTLLIALVVAVCLGRGGDSNWQWIWSGANANLLDLRLPRVVAAFAGGAMFAVAGVILQRLTGNEMASPEVLGISAGATFAIAISLFVVASPGIGVQMGFAGAGAFAVLGIILLLARGTHFAPERVLLAGIALSAMVDALIGALSSAGDPRALLLLRWMSGSTYSAGVETAIGLAMATGILITLALLARRWLDLMPLGAEAIKARGVPLARSRLSMFGLAGLLSAAATIGVGPLSFVGLMGPHLARELGLVRALPQTAGAALIGGTLLVLADWLGRDLVFPYQIPAGLMSALVGAPFLILLLARRR